MFVILNLQPIIVIPGHNNRACKVNSISIYNVNAKFMIQMKYQFFLSFLVNRACFYVYSIHYTCTMEMTQIQQYRGGVALYNINRYQCYEEKMERINEWSKRMKDRKKREESLTDKIVTLQKLHMNDKGEQVVFQTHKTISYVSVF